MTTDRWASIADPLARFRAMGSALDLYQAQRLGALPMAWADQSEWDDYAARKQALQNEWVNALSPVERSRWDSDSAFSAAQNKKHMNTGMAITGGLIGLGAGAMTLGQLGLLGGANAGAPAAAEGAGSAGTGSAVEMGFNAGGVVPAGESGWAGLSIPGPAATSTIPTALEAGATGLGAAVPALPASAATAATVPAASSPGLLGGLGSAATGALDWMKANPGLTSLLGGALAAAGSGGSAGSGSASAQPTFATQPGLTMNPLRQLQGASTGGLFSAATPGSARQNSGLARFGSWGGMYSPGGQQPAIWGR